MDKQRIGVIGAIVIACIALVGGLYLTAQGVEVPSWLATILVLVGTGFAWLIKPPGEEKQ